MTNENKTYKIEENSQLSYLVTKLKIDYSNYANPKNGYVNSEDLLKFDSNKKEYTQKDLNGLEKQLIAAYGLNKQYKGPLNASITANHLSALYGVLENKEKDGYWAHIGYEDEKLFHEQEKKIQGR